MLLVPCLEHWADAFRRLSISYYPYHCRRSPRWKDYARCLLPPFPAHHPHPHHRSPAVPYGRELYHFAVVDQYPLHAVAPALGSWIAVATVCEADDESDCELDLTRASVRHGAECLSEGDKDGDVVRQLHQAAAPHLHRLLLTPTLSYCHCCCLHLHVVSVVSAWCLSYAFGVCALSSPSSSFRCVATSHPMVD